MTDVTVKLANAMMIGNSVTVTGGVSNLGPSNGTFVVEKINDKLWQITKFPKSVSRQTARTLLMLKRHGPLILAGNAVLCDETRERVAGITRRTVMSAEGVAIDKLTGRVTMTNRGRGFFRSQERLVFDVPVDMVDAVTEAVNNALDRHHD